MRTTSAGADGRQAEDRSVARRMTASVDARTERIAKRFEVPMLIAASCASPNERRTPEC
jgi:hypothetical protein